MSDKRAIEMREIKRYVSYEDLARFMRHDINIITLMYVSRDLFNTDRDNFIEIKIIIPEISY